MKPLSELRAEDARKLEGVVFDLDDTLLDGGALTEEAYRALFRLKEAGLSLVACTGRPSGWGEVMARQWPVDAVVSENGAIRAIKDGDRIRRFDPCDSEERERRRARLRDVAAELLSHHAELVLADDNAARITDTTLDIGEHRHVAREIVAKARGEAERAGVRVFVSSIHMHLTLDKLDKASGTVAFLVSRGTDPTYALRRYAYVGDSENDGPAFAAFRLTFGVANVRACSRRLSIPPRFLAERARGAGFAEISARIVGLRNGAST